MASNLEGGSASPRTAHEAALLLHASQAGSHGAMHDPYMSAEHPGGDVGSGATGSGSGQVEGGSGRNIPGSSRASGDYHLYGAQSTAGPSAEGYRPSKYGSATYSAPNSGRPPKKPRRTSDTPNFASHETDHTDNSKTAKRASQACLRCRRQKLRCLGGWPCDRCTKGRYECDFGAANLPPGPRPGSGQQSAAAAAAAEANARLHQLESSVASLLAGLANGQGGQGARGADLGNLLAQAGLDRHMFDVQNGLGMAGGQVPSLHDFVEGVTGGRSGAGQPAAGAARASAETTGTWQGSLPPPTHSRPIITPRLASDLPEGGVNPSHDSHVRFAASPHTAYSAPSLTSPSNAASSGISPGSALSGEGSHAKRAGKQKKGQKAEERLAAATEGEYEPPFKSLVFQVSLSTTSHELWGISS